MRKLYRKGVVHPSPPAPETISERYLSFLPAAILTLTVGLSPEELEVLSYLITHSSSSSSSSSNYNPTNNRKTAKKKAAINVGKEQHPSNFFCDCFSCYMSYWAKWDSSSNRDLIHVAIDAFEDSLSTSQRKPSNPSRRKRGSTRRALAKDQRNLDESKAALGERGAADSEVEGGGDDDGAVAAAAEVKGPVRRLVSLIGERVFGVWGS